MTLHSPTSKATRRLPQRRSVAAALLTGALGMLGASAGGCRGPRLTVPTDGIRIVDGRVTPPETLPFRYYGTTVVDVLPPVPGEPLRVHEMFRRAPNREYVEVREPVTPWVFPFDLPLELLATLFGGIDDRVAPVRTAEAPATVVLGAVPGEVEQLRSRANAARLSR